MAQNKIYIINLYKSNEYKLFKLYNIKKFKYFINYILFIQDVRVFFYINSKIKLINILVAVMNKKKIDYLRVNHICLEYHYLMPLKKVNVSIDSFYCIL